MRNKVEIKTLLSNSKFQKEAIKINKTTVNTAIKDSNNIENITLNFDTKTIKSKG